MRERRRGERGPGAGGGWGRYRRTRAGRGRERAFEGAPVLYHLPSCRAHQEENVRPSLLLKELLFRGGGYRNKRRQVCALLSHRSNETLWRRPHNAAIPLVNRPCSLALHASCTTMRCRRDLNSRDVAGRTGSRQRPPSLRGTSTFRKRTTTYMSVIPRIQRAARSPRASARRPGHSSCVQIGKSVSVR